MGAFQFATAQTNNIEQISIGGTIVVGCPLFGVGKFVDTRVSFGVGIN